MPKRLRSFRFVREKDGKREECFFYAKGRKTATDYALAWGRKHGYKMYRLKA